MKIMRDAMLVLALLMVATGSFAQTDATELLKNPDFEEVGANGLPTGWAKYAGQGPEQKLEMSDDAHSGAHSVHIVDNGPNVRDGKHSVGITQDVVVEGGTYYQATVWVKMAARNNGAALNMQLLFLPSNKLQQIPLAPEIGGDWTRFKLNALAPEGTTSVRMYLYTMHFWTCDTLIDNVSLRPVDITPGELSSALMSQGVNEIEKVRTLNLRTPMVEGGVAKARILVPFGDKYAAMGRKIADAIAKKTGKTLEVTSTYEGTVESQETIIALGNLNNNRMIERLYMNKYLVIDSLKPGAGKFVLQTVHEPYNGPKGKNVIVIGASNDEDLGKGVDEFIGRLGDGPDLVLEQPMLYVSGISAMSEADKEKLMADPLPTDPLLVFWRAVQSYRDTGDIAYAERAKQVLMATADMLAEKPEYRITWPEETTSNMIGAMWDVVEEAPVWEDDERLEATNALLLAALKLRHHTSGYSGLENTDTIIWNHTTFPLLGIYWIARYVDRYYPELQADMETMLTKVHACFEGQIASWKPQEDSLGYYSIVPSHEIDYTLAENDYRYFENGSVRRHADYTIAIADNTGDPGGFGDSGYGHGPYVSNINWALWYYKDGRYLWWLNKVLENGYANPYDPNVKERAWPEIAGTHVFELHPQVYDYTKDKSYYGGPVSPPNIPLEKAFDKISFREGLDPQGEFILLDGYSRGKHLQYDGNAIIKYYADGEDWLIDGDYLVRNTTDHNMLSIVKDGRAENLEPTCTALEASADLPGAGITQTKVYEYNGVDWTRNIVWFPGECTVVLDQLEAREDGDYTFVGNWKTRALGEQTLKDGEFLTSKPSTGGIGTKALAELVKPAEGVEKAMKFVEAHSRLDTALDLPAGEYSVTTYARAFSTGADSFYLSIDGGDKAQLHIPVGLFGPSSSASTKDTPTPNVEVKSDGLHVLSFTLREGPGAELDRFVVHNQAGEIVAEIEAENAPPLPDGLWEDAGYANFYVKNDGYAHNALASRISHVGMKITYLRQRLGGEMAAGEKAALFNVFYNDTSLEPKGYDIARVSDEQAILLKNGEQYALISTGKHPAGELLTGAKVSALTADTLYVAGLTAAVGVFSSDAPFAMELDLATGKATLRRASGGSVQLATGAVAQLENGEITLDCNETPLVERLKAVRVDAIAPPTGNGNGVEASAALQADWSRPIALEAKEDEQPIWGIYPLDLEGDGTEEFVVLRGRWAECVDASGKQLWRFGAGQKCRACASADIDGDGKLEVFVGSDDEHVYVLNSSGVEIAKHHTNIPLRVGMSSVRPPKVANIVVDDIDGDDVLDVIVCLLNGNLLRYNLEFEELWRYDAIPHGSVEMETIDLDGDGQKEIVLANHYGGVQIFDAKGIAKRGPYSELGDVQMAIGTMNADPAYEIANGSATGTFTLQQYEGSDALHFNNYGFAAREVLMADVQGDEADELLVGSETGYAYILDANAETIAQRDFGEVVTDLGIISMPDEVKSVIAAGLANGKVYLMDGTAELLGEWDAKGEVVQVEALKTAAGEKIIVATGDTVSCLTP